ncbi:MAG: PEP-CTERM sorting domain-containing protein, partial [Verrucomicrobiae bacterium]|nr:PEP-CTERM sorting domain-containing protein [Verrucomicrobiae bacterium]
GGGGNYLWEINNFTGTMGADPGWDLINVTGNLDITATSGSPFNINLTTLTLANAAGLAVNWDGSINQSWTILSAGSITGFMADKFNLNAAGFQNPYSGTFGITQSGNNLVLTYTAAIPEPSTYALMALGGAMAAFVLRRRQNRK